MPMSTNYIPSGLTNYPSATAQPNYPSATVQQQLPGAWTAVRR
jgi:hypothetical protein